MSFYFELITEKVLKYAKVDIFMLKGILIKKCNIKLLNSEENKK